MDPLVIAFGLGVGILVGMTGIGGGSLMTPLLILFVGVNPSVAIGTDLAYGAITKTVGGWRHLRQGTVDLGISKWMAFGSVPGSIMGVAAIEILHNHYGKSMDDVLLAAVAVALIIAAVLTLLRTALIKDVAAKERHAVEMTRGTKIGAMSIGFVLGVILGLTSVGSGALIGLALILIFRLVPHRVVGTDVFHAAIVLWAAGLAHFFVGNVDFVLMGTILVGSLPGVWIGTGLAKHVPAAGLRPTLGCVLLAAALGVASKAGLNFAPTILIGVPCAVGFAMWMLHLSRTRTPRLPEAPIKASPERI